MLDTPTVSVLIPAYNAARWIGPAIDSALAQAYAPCEIIVVNDGSTDTTRETLRTYERRGVRVFDQPQSGKATAANRAFRESTGEFIKFFDADDLLGADHLARQVAAIASRPGHVAMGEWGRFSNDPATATFPERAVYTDAEPVDWIVADWTGARPMIQCGAWLVPRAVLLRSGLWDERLSLIDDFEFFARLLLHAERIVYTPGARLYYRSGVPSSLSQRTDRRAIESAFLSLTLGTSHLLRVEDSARTRRVCADLLQDFVYASYPRHPDLRARSLRRVHDLGGSALRPDGPPGFQMLRRGLGWRLARRIQRTVEALALNRAALRTRWRAVTRRPPPGTSLPGHVADAQL